ncbi:predicted protein [Histoplasma capsulatum var. duboisii H88]|uniref:Predicted protein n=1 Tax=Ajellomyces capsulatus (strain H88) TaxID=544711 RepID=F0U821_AJEC8|nr:predicted protein [Histoplasma capsulatum var. duboisii H88]
MANDITLSMLVAGTIRELHQKPDDNAPRSNIDFYQQAVLHSTAGEGRRSFDSTAPSLNLVTRDIKTLETIEMRMRSGTQRNNLYAGLSCGALCWVERTYWTLRVAHIQPRILQHHSVCVANASLN